jgi:hypothetical protein
VELKRHSIFIENNKIDVNVIIENMKTDFIDRMNLIDDYCKDAINIVERQMGKVEILAKDNVNKKEDDLKLMFDAEIRNVRDSMR